MTRFTIVKTPTSLRLGIDFRVLKIDFAKRSFARSKEIKKYKLGMNRDKDRGHPLEIQRSVER